MEIFNYYHESETETLEPVFTKGKLISIANKGKIRSEETRSKMSESAKNRTREQNEKRLRATYETRIANGSYLRGEKNPNFGRIASEETRVKISKAGIGKTHSAESRAKMRESRKDKSNLGLVWHTPFGVFTTSVLAGEAEGLTPSGIRRRCRDEKFPDYFRKKT